MENDDRRRDLFERPWCEMLAFEQSKAQRNLQHDWKRTYQAGIQERGSVVEHPATQPRDWQHSIKRALTEARMGNKQPACIKMPMNAYEGHAVASYKVQGIPVDPWGQAFGLLLCEDGTQIRIEPPQEGV